MDDVSQMRRVSHHIAWHGMGLIVHWSPKIDEENPRSTLVYVLLDSGEDLGCDVDSARYVVYNYRNRQGELSPNFARLGFIPTKSTVEYVVNLKYICK
jgi:hypothetical protein